MERSIKKELRNRLNEVADPDAEYKIDPEDIGDITYDDAKRLPLAIKNRIEDRMSRIHGQERYLDNKHRLEAQEWENAYFNLLLAIASHNGRYHT